MPTLYVCVYRRHIPTAAEWRQMTEKSSGDPRLARFLDEYWRDDRYYDWGDDPSFFGAREAFNDARRASWGVCRRDVRSAVKAGEAVSFFIGKPAFDVKARGGHVPNGAVDYFYVGCGTVGQLANRFQLWEDDGLAKYRDFYNALARPGPGGRLENIEVFPRHENWQDRAAAPLVLFDPGRTWFDLDTPRYVAHYDPALGVPERWNADPISRRLEGLLFGDGRPRRLRTSHTGYGHAKRVLRLADREFAEVRDELVRIAHAAG